MSWSERERGEIVDALAVVCEVTGADFSNPAKLFLVRELESYGSAEVLTALRRCAREVTYKLALAHVIERIEDQREKDKAGRRALASAEETQIRLAALDARIPWELGKEKVREMLAQIGKGLPAHDPAKERDRERIKRLSEGVRHWQETEKD
jgi:hypothetical protein